MTGERERKRIDTDSDTDPDTEEEKKDESQPIHSPDLVPAGDGVVRIKAR